MMSGWRIRLSDPAETVPGWRFDTEQDALDKITRARLTMNPDRIDPRWVSSAPFSEAVASCEKCDHDAHICKGCGEPLAHGAEHACYWMMPISRVG